MVTNLPVTKWGEHTSHHGHCLCNNLKENSPIQFLQNPENHVLDLVLVTKDEVMENLNVGEKLSNCHHRGITFAINLLADESNKRKRNSPWLHKNTFFCELRSVLNQTDWSWLRITTDIDDQLKFSLINIKKKNIQEYVPMKDLPT